MSLPSFTPEPASLRHEIVSEEQLAIEFANEAARRFRQLGQGRRGTPEAAAFGELVRDRRQLMGEGRLRLAQRARVNPVYLSMLENGLLAPDEVPAAVVAKLAVAFRKPLAELPLTPYQVDHEPQDAVELEPNGARVWLGLDTLRPWVDVMVRSDEPMSTVGIPLPLIRLDTSPLLRIEDAWFTNALLPGLESDEYSWRLVSGRPGQPTWSLYARTLAEPDRRPLPDVGLELDMGAQRRWAVSDQIGRLHFDRLDPADIEPLRFLRADGDAPDRRPR